MQGAVCWRIRKWKEWVKLKFYLKKSLLKTNTLFFDKENNIVYYINGANTKQDESQIFSKKGFYNTKTKYLKLSDSVRVKNPEYTIKSDTLEYSTNSKTSYFLGPTNIQLKEEKVYCEAGFYNQTLEIGQFEQNAILQKDQQSLSADSIYFNKSWVRWCNINIRKRTRRGKK